MDTATYRQERNRLTASIKKTVKPFLWKSGFRTRDAKGQGNGNLFIWVPKNKADKPTGQQFSLRQGFVCVAFEGFTSEGVITDGFAGGLSTLNYECMPIEDLFRLHAWVVRKFVKPITLVPIRR
ncbi:MAG: hypothetical protein Q7S87_10215 [Agitococcus sp.]|nr:hypothetical protein [Agitococcus sp.]MDO9179298.1 hypothetical protein [Agitococcus sp.]